MLSQKHRNWSLFDLDSMDVIVKRAMNHIRRNEATVDSEYYRYVFDRGIEDLERVEHLLRIMPSDDYGAVLDEMLCDYDYYPNADCVMQGWRNPEEDLVLVLEVNYLLGTSGWEIRNDRDYPRKYGFLDPKSIIYQGNDKSEWAMAIEQFLVMLREKYGLEEEI